MSLEIANPRSYFIPVSIFYNRIILTLFNKMEWGYGPLEPVSGLQLGCADELVRYDFVRCQLLFGSEVKMTSNSKTPTTKFGIELFGLWRATIAYSSEAHHAFHRKDRTGCQWPCPRMELAIRRTFHLSTNHLANK